MRFLPLALLLGSAVAIAAPAPSAAATTVTSQKPVNIVVRMVSHDFRPQVIRLPSGRPIRLVVRNMSGNGHDFHAPQFFNACQIDDADAGKISNASLEVPKYATVTLRLIAKPGHYDLESTKAMDVVASMKGQILVY
jgi:plastocyanin